LQTVGLQGFLFWGKGKMRGMGRRGIWWKIGPIAQIAG
jgi:hypothetical protein